MSEKLDEEEDEEEEEEKKKENKTASPSAQSATLSFTAPVAPVAQVPQVQMPMPQPVPQMPPAVQVPTVPPEKVQKLQELMAQLIVLGNELGLEIAIVECKRAEKCPVILKGREIIKDIKQLRELMKNLTPKE